MAKRPVGTAKIKAWTERSTMECAGSIDGCALELFGMVAGRDGRELLMAKMRERHERLCELEDPRP
jgi:hypothetical protein